MGCSHLGCRRALALAFVAVLAGCASTTHRAPVEERKAAPARVPTPVAAVAAPAASAAGAESSVPRPPPAGTENAGKPGYYTVKPGDTLIRIALDNGQNWRDVARWNGLDNPNVIEVGQVLRVVPPAADAGGVTVRPVAAAGRVDGRPLDARAAGVPSSAAASGSSPAAPAASAAGISASAAASAAPVAAAREGDDEPSWAWPAAGPVVTPFDDVKSKGLAIAGKAGDPVVAAADGRVVYAGAGLRGYGNLVIVKHNATYLTAYAHNQTLLVKEDQAVRRGQKIAEMGSSDADSVQLHFEIRRQGKPIDPARLLPAR
jgi:lipoprotein NlpD